MRYATTNIILSQVKTFYTSIPFLQNFSEFARNHPLIEVFKLRAFTQFVGKPSPVSWNLESWKNFAKLKSFSIEPLILEGNSRIICLTRKIQIYIHLSEQRNQLWQIRKLGENRQLHPENLSYLSVVAQSCPLIQELELASFVPNINRGWKLRAEELFAIAQCVHLKKLTISNLSIPDGRFLEKVP